MSGEHGPADIIRNGMKDLYGVGHARPVRASWAFSHEEFWSHQAHRLERVLRHCVRDVPYYRERSSEYMNGDIAMKGPACPPLLEVLSELPVLRKETVRERTSDFLDQGKSLPVKIHTTSGTTGSPLKVAANIWERSLMFEILSQWYSRLTGKKHPRTVIMRGFRVPETEGEIFWISGLTGDMHLSIYSLNRERASEIAGIFRAYHPDLIFGYSSAVNQLAQVIGEEVGDTRDSRIAIVTSEVLQPKWRSNIESMLCGKVYDLYTSEEGSHLALQCDAGTMHINPLIGIVEILDDRGSHVESGGSGKVVVTGLSKTSMPLIRYDLGDVAVSTGYDHFCACGLRWPSIGSIEGRDEDLVVTRDGRSLAHMVPFATKDLDGIWESQLLQVGYEAFVMRIVEDKGRQVERSRIERAIRSEIEKRMEAKVSIEFEYVEDIPRCDGGKFKALVVEVEHGREDG
jgi:phenylacetate-CoA ligase